MASGGKRDGSGRKSVHPTEKRVQMCITIAPETRDRLLTLRKKGQPIGRLIDRWTEDFCNKEKNTTFVADE